MVIAVEVVVASFDHIYDLKTELDVAFETAVYTGERRESAPIHAGVVVLHSQMVES